MALKNEPNGLSIAELRLRFPTLTDEAIESLKNNEAMIYDSQSNRIIYKDVKKIPFTNREELLVALQNEPILLDSDTQQAYPTIMDDIQVCSV